MIIQMRFICCFIYLLSLYTIPLNSQQDSLLPIQSMDKSAILFHKKNTFNQKVITASQSLKEVKDLPFTIYVITKEEILKNGYVTLVDALKMVPGIRISQPGSAFEGETFLMRGLRGNAYTKILIDGVDFKPSVVSGMPIGAQLPIQQAERIEIIYGPVAALYGADAAAGVINIILKKTERPVFVQAGLQLGEVGYTGLSLMFGGRLGKTKNVLDYVIYANNTEYQDTKIRHRKDPQLFNPFNRNYNPGFPLSINPNYTSSGIDTVALIEQLPHLSRVIGAHFSYKTMELSINSMYRKDHSALGLNPGAASYGNPLNFIGENILNINFNISKQYKKWGFKTTLNYMDFEMDNRSSKTTIYDAFSIAAGFINDSKATSSTGDFDDNLFLALSENTFNQYTTGSRYSYAASNRSQLAQVFNLFPSSIFELTAGFTLSFHLNTPLTEYSPIPLVDFGPKGLPQDSIHRFFNVPFSQDITGEIDFSSFIQSYITLEKWNIIAGVQYYEHSNFGKAINPRIALLYQLTPKLSIRGFYGTAFRRPPQFFETTNYQFNINTNAISFVNSLTPEKTRSFELGLRWFSNENFNADITTFYSSTENLLFYNLDFIADEFMFLERINLEYRNFSESESSLLGIQSSFRFKNIWKPVKLNTDLHIQIGKINESMVINDDEEGFQGNVNEQPRLMIQSRTTLTPYNRYTLVLDGVYMGNFRNKGFGDRGLFSRSYFTFDILSRFQVSNNFSTFIKVNNIFNQEYAGIDAYGTLDDLDYNPQRKRFVRIGMNYLLE